VVPDATLAQPRLFLTFAGADLSQARRLAANLRGAGAVALDYAVPSEPFAAQRSGLIRASLVVRLKRCAATLCLYGAGTLDDEWVSWTLKTSRELRLPLLGAPLEAPGPGEVAGLLRSIGAEIVAPRGEAIAGMVSSGPRRRDPITVEALAHTLHMLKQPLR
jgi:hypothetical protein